MRAGRKSTAAAIAALVSATFVAVVVAMPTPAAAAPARSIWGIPGRGATVPFIEHEAEYAGTNGSHIGPDRTYTTLPSEASGRQAVTLDAVGEYVEFTLTAPANAMVLRYSIPDSPDGTGRNASLAVRANGSVVKSMPVTSRYGWYYGGYPFNNNPGDTNPHHFYDEERTLLGSTYPAGTRIRVQVTSTAQSPSFTIDLADFELVAPPIAKPANVIDVVTDFGADPTGGPADNTAKFQAAVDAGRAQGKTVWIPAGTYTLWDHVVVDQVTLRGAGMWHSVLTGRHPTDRSRAVGVYGKYVAGGGYGGGIRPHEAGGPSRDVTLRDFAIIGDIRERVDHDQVNAIGGALSDSVIQNVWLENTKCGAWMDGPMDNLVIRDSRIVDQIADGVNFHHGVTNSAVTNTFLRNTGDDALAMWAQDQPNVANSFDHNTVAVTILANHIVTYGGRDIRITDNVTADTLTNGGGIHVANRYPGVNGPTAVSGTITVARNTLIRNGNSDYNWRFGVGAIWFSGLNEPINATINVTDTDIFDSSYAALHWIEGQIRTVNFSNVRIENTGTYALQVQAPGAATFTNVTATGIAQGPDNLIHNCVGSGFAITQGSGNSGWYDPTPYCGPWHEPDWTPPPSTSPPTTSAPPSSPPPSSPPPSPTPQITATSHTQTYVAANAIDGNANTYWESANNAFPQSLTLDLGTTQSIGRVVLKLPPSWGSRTQTLSVLGSTNGSSYSTLVGSRGYNFPAGGSVSIDFAPTTRRFVRLTFTANTGWPAAQIAEFEVHEATGSPSPSPTPTSPTPSPTPTEPPEPQAAAASSHTQTYAAANAIDGNANTYWESANNAWPQWITVDLGAAKSVSRIVLKLPPSSAWGTRTQTLTVLGSTNGATFTTLAGSTGYTFNPATGNTVTVTFAATTQRYLRLNVTGNTGWPAAQLSEFEVYS